LSALYKLRDLGNTLLLVEHDHEVIAGADQLLDFGPAAGTYGGEIVARGTPKQVMKQKGSVTGPYLSGGKTIAIPSNRRMEASAECGVRSAELKKSNKRADKDNSALRIPNSELARLRIPNSALEILGARHNNLRNINVTIPLGAFTVITGVSGSGKSSLVEDVLYNALAKTLHRASVQVAPHDAIRGVEQINKVIRVDQQPLGQTPTSNPATYTGVFELIRTLFAQLPESKLRGYTARRFSFNVPGGRCEKCEGNGQLRIEMHFLPDVWVECDVCRGKRYNPETLAVRYRGQSIADVLAMPCSKAVQLFENIPKIRHVLQTLCDVGLDYITLGQPAPTLSGGEAQRVKLAAELSRPDTGRTLYLLDEPTTGLHFDDLVKLLDVLNRLVDLGNTVVVIEHNLDVIKTADWVIDMGPEAGDGGGYVVAAGTPEQIVAHAERHHQQNNGAGLKNGSRGSKRKSKIPEGEAGNAPCLRSHTGEALAPILAAGPYAERKIYDFAQQEEKRDGDLEITQVGRDAQMPWEADGRRWHTEDRVGRNGEPCRWDGQILSRVIDRIHELGSFSTTDWKNRTVVEICAEKKSDGWFFHAITGEQWLLKLKFRVSKNTFKRNGLIEQLDLKPLNEMRDLPVYGSEPRVKCKNLRGPWQEVQLAVHSWSEIDKPAFWNFLEAAVAGFSKFTERIGQNPEDVMPWKVLGQKWHFSRKGFPPGKKVYWTTELLEELCELLSEVAPSGQFLWNNQQLVHLYVAPQREPWATLYTKRTQALELVLTGPKDRYGFGRVAQLGRERELQTADKLLDVLKLKFQTSEDLARGELVEFLQEHVAGILGSTVR
jgi:excinuclease ABC subunit A